MNARAWRLPDDPIGYGRQTIDERDVEAVVAALTSDHLTQGPLVPAFEAELASATGAPDADRVVAVATGTAALRLALASLGVGPGSRVVTTANTFLASATAALHCGAAVEFVDIELETGNLDLACLESRLESAAPDRCGQAVDAVVAVHFAGRPCDLSGLVGLRERFGFALVVDACHALGGTAAVDGTDLRVGEVPGVDAACLSFHPVKQVTTGEGGAILFSDADAAGLARRLREHGLRRAADRLPFEDSATSPCWFAPMEVLGFNSRLSELHAALGTSQLTRLEQFVAERRSLAERYDDALGGLSSVVRPELVPGHAWHLYPVRVPAEDRDELMAFLAEGGIGTQLHYYPVPLQPYFRATSGATEADYPNAVEHARTALSLPLFPTLGHARQDRVVAGLSEWFEQ